MNSNFLCDLCVALCCFVVSHLYEFDFYEESKNEIMTNIYMEKNSNAMQIIKI